MFIKSGLLNISAPVQPLKIFRSTRQIWGCLCDQNSHTLEPSIQLGDRSMKGRQQTCWPWKPWQEVYPCDLLAIIGVSNVFFNILMSIKQAL